MLKHLKSLVGAAGFEPATSCSQSKRATKLRYAPTIMNECFDSDGFSVSQMPAPGG